MNGETAPFGWRGANGRRGPSRERMQNRHDLAIDCRAVQALHKGIAAHGIDHDRHAASRGERLNAPYGILAAWVCSVVSFAELWHRNSRA
jgi:hypothetical protein